MPGRRPRAVVGRGFYRLGTWPPRGRSTIHSCAAHGEHVGHRWPWPLPAGPRCPRSSGARSPGISVGRLLAARRSPFRSAWAPMVFRRSLPHRPTCRARPVWPARCRAIQSPIRCLSEIGPGAFTLPWMASLLALSTRCLHPHPRPPTSWSSPRWRFPASPQLPSEPASVRSLRPPTAHSTCERLLPPPDVTLRTALARHAARRVIDVLTRGGFQ
jgi:hypothetical protein